MNEATITLTIMTGGIGIVFLGFLIWAIKTGQFHNVEEAKYQVFREQRQEDTDNDDCQNKDREVTADAKSQS